MPRQETGQNQTPRLADWSDRELLDSRICDLPIAASPEQSPLRANIVGWRHDLASQGLRRFLPKLYFGDEWFSPSGLAAIALPFYLAHPRLRQIERQAMGQVEGGSPLWCRKLLRHETGHCFDHAFNLSRSKRWQAVFGDPSRRYSVANYNAEPNSPDFVTNLEDNYAQSHPDEDFAETFAVLLNNEYSWRTRYRVGSRARQKLDYTLNQIERHSHRTAPPIPVGETLPFRADRMRMTLRRYYEKRILAQGKRYVGYYDQDLAKVFRPVTEIGTRDVSATTFLIQNRRHIRAGASDAGSAADSKTNATIKRLEHRLSKHPMVVERDTSRTLAAITGLVISINQDNRPAERRLPSWLR